MSAYVGAGRRLLVGVISTLSAIARLAFRRSDRGIKEGVESSGGGSGGRAKEGR